MAPPGEQLGCQRKPVIRLDALQTALRHPHFDRHREILGDHQRSPMARQAIKLPSVLSRQNTTLGNVVEQSQRRTSTQGQGDVRAKRLALEHALLVGLQTWQ